MNQTIKEKIIGSLEEYLSPELPDGNKEYKLILKTDDPNRIEQLTTQLRYRVKEGDGEALYTLGISDDGGIVGLIEEEYKKSLDILNLIASKNDYTVNLISEYSLPCNSKKMYEFLVRENNPKKYIDLKIAYLGSVDSGKSTLVGVLITGIQDNGRGSARLNVFNYSHEVKTGQTSSISQHILGFNTKGEIVNYEENLGYKKSWPEIVNNSSKVITLFDLCGHAKYLKTTILGITTQSPDVVFILVGGNMGLTNMTKEHIFLCLSLHIPFAIIITKIDICENRKNVLEQTVGDVKKLLKAPGIRRIPYDIKSLEDIILINKNIYSMSMVPIFYVSSVSGEGLNYLRQFLNILNRNSDNKPEAVNKVEYYVDKIFRVPGLNLVLGGQLISGKIKIGDKLLIGPTNGVYNNIQVRSLHCKRVNITEVDSGCYVCIGLKKNDNLNIRKGSVVISGVDKPLQVREFRADILVIKGTSTTIKVGYEPVLHTCAVRQTAKIVEIINKKCDRNQEDNSEVLRAGDRATISFRFTHHSEYIKAGSRVLLCEGLVKIIGKITEITEEVVKVL